MTSKSKNILRGGLIIAALALLVTRLFFVGIYRIPQNGMYPGLPAGSQLFAIRHPYSNASSVKRGDVVVFTREENGQRCNYIWRVIALPGESVEASGDSLVINGQGIKRKHIREADDKRIFREQIGDASYEVAFDLSPHHLPPDVSITLASGEFFVMGDNRFDDFDSRSFGPIMFSSIIAKKF